MRDAALVVILLVVVTLLYARWRIKRLKAEVMQLRRQITGRRPKGCSG